MKGFITTLVGNTVFANVLLLTIITVGILAATSMVREDLPELSFNLLEVQVSFPGADPEETEEGISRRIEAVIDGMEGVKQYHTYSGEGYAEATIEIDEGQDMAEMKERVRNAIDSVSTFPAKAEKPRIVELKDDDEVIDIALWGDLPERQLKEWAEQLRSDLQRHPDISLVSVGDTRDYEINIEISKERLLEYGLTIQDVSEVVNRESLNLSSGTMKTEGQEIRIRTIGRKYNGRDFGSIVVKASPDGELITLDRLATIKDEFADDPTYATFNGHPCALMWIQKAPGEDAITIADAVREFCEEEQKKLPAGLHISPCFDDSEFIRGQLRMLSRNGILGLCIVLFVLWLFLNTRLSFWVAMGIPISLCGALIIMWAGGHTINQISLITFIVVLGIIVDDAIVVGEAIFVHRKRGQPPLQAAVEGVAEVGLPVIAAVLTTIAAFLPLAFVPGYMGQIMVIMPLVVISALLVSLVECLFLLPAHLSNLPALNSGADGFVSRRKGVLHLQYHAGHALEWFAEKVYARAVKHAVNHRYVGLCVAAAVIMITVGLYGGGFVRVVFWPPADGGSLRAYIEFPPGTPASVTRDAIRLTREGIERVAARTETKTGEPLIRNMYTRVYRGMPERGRIYTEIVDASKRNVHSQDLSAAWEKEVGSIPGALSLRFREDAIGFGGPAIEIWLLAKDMNVLREATKELKDKLRTYDGVYEVADSFRPGKMELQVKLKPEAHALGLSLDHVSRHLRAGYYGEEAVRFQRGRDDVRVRVRFPKDERRALAELERTRIRTPRGFEVPFLSVADVQYTQGYSSIQGSNGLRRLVVWASVDTNRIAPHEVLTDLSDNYMDTFIAGYPHLQWDVHGTAESNEETLGGLKSGFAIAVLGIFIIMATVFRSYLQPFVIILIIPFGIVGAALGHLALGIPVTFLSLFGLVALSGVVVNDAIVLTECVNRLLSEGVPFYDAVCRGGVRRFRAIFLTTVSTSAGLTPIMLEKDLQAQMVIPMAVSIAAGVAFATVLTLLLLPCLLTILNDLRRIAYRMRHKEWPIPEQVEPATRRASNGALPQTPSAQL